MTKFYAYTRSYQIIEIELSDTIEKIYGVKSGTVCTIKDDIGNSRVIPVCLFGNNLWFACLEKNGLYRLSYWDNVKDEDSFNKIFTKTNQIYNDYELSNLIEQPPENELEDIKKTRNAIKILVKSKWLQIEPMPTLSQEEKQFQNNYEERMAKRRKLDWDGKKETKAAIINMICR